MSVKKTLAGIASYALVGAVALGIGGTLATQTDVASAENTATVGNVKIDLIEQEYVEGKLVDFTQDKPIYPASYESLENKDENGMWKGVTGAIDKIVSVDNVGTGDMYYRTIIAVEHTTDDVVVLNTNETNFVWSEVEGTVNIKGTNYDLYVATYKTVYKPDDAVVSSLRQVALSKDATNADVEELGDKLDILVFAQACQVENLGSDPAKALDTAFGGEISVTNHPWISKPVEDVAALEKALEQGGDIAVSNDLTLTESLTITEDTVLTLNADFDASGIKSDRPFHLAEGATLTINADGQTVTVGDYGLVNVPSDVKEASIVLNGGTYKGKTANGALIRLRSGNEKVSVELNNVTYTDTAEEGYIISTQGFSGDAEITINGGSFTAHTGIQTEGKTTVTGAIINTDSVAFECQGNTVIEDCTITVAPGVTVATAPAAAVATSGNGHVEVKNCKISGTMQAVYYVYSSGGTIIASGNDITGVADGVAQYKNGLNLNEYPNAEEHIEIDDEVVVE